MTRGPSTLTKAEIAQALVDGVGLNKREAKDMVEAFFHEIARQLEQGNPVKLSGFGHFSLRVKPERLGRNPKTGDEAVISARRVVTFHPSQKLLCALSAADRAAKRTPATGELPTKSFSRLIESDGEVGADINRV